MTTKHTPAPWKIGRPFANTGNISVTAWREDGKENQQIALATCGEWGYELAPDRQEAKANAYLISAAPELLACLSRAIRYLSEPIFPRVAQRGCSLALLGS
jgi:hypothetical protein